MEEKLTFAGELDGHNGWVTGICTGNQNNPNLLVSVSRDRSLLIWKLDFESHRDEIVNVVGHPYRSLTAHSHFISDVVLSSDSNFALTGSWDSTLRLWDLNAGLTTYRFIGHTKDVLSVTMSPDNRQIISSSRDRTIKLWNTIAECKYTFEDPNMHTDWVSCVRFTPTTKDPMIVSAGWDNTVKLWSHQDFSYRTDLIGHTNVINSIAISPDGNFIASGGKDNIVYIWSIKDSERMSRIDCRSSVNALSINPTRYWIAIACDSKVKIWDLDSKNILFELDPLENYYGQIPANPPNAISVAWSIDGDILYAGYTDNKIRAYTVVGKDIQE